jgi:hypothetical protein
MTKRTPNWFSIGAQMWLSTLEAQQVIALRTAKIMRGGKSADPEIRAMLSEKLQAAMQAQQMGLRLALGGGAAQIPRKTVSVYRRKVRTNRRRLLKEL